MLRIAFAAIGNPNCALLTAVFQLVNVTWLSAFVESTRKSRLNRSFNRNVRPIDALNVN
jgi:hypothetical protein